MTYRIQLFDPTRGAQQPAGDDVPVGIKGNNPGNIVASGNRHPGQVGVIYGNNGRGYKLFATMADGVAAQGGLLLRYQESDTFKPMLRSALQHIDNGDSAYAQMRQYRSGMDASDGINTLAEMIVVYAPPTDGNQTHDYIEFVANDVRRNLRARAAELRQQGHADQAAALEQKAANFNGITKFNLREDPILMAAVQEAMMKQEIGTRNFERYIGRANVQEGVRRITGISHQQWDAEFGRVDPGQLRTYGVDANPYGRTDDERSRPITPDQEEDNAAQNMAGQLVLGFIAMLFAAFTGINAQTQAQTPPAGAVPATTGQFADVTGKFDADAVRYFDANHDGKVLANEVAYLFDDVSQASLGNIKINLLDTDHDGRIGQAEAVRLDRDGNGSIDTADIEEIRRMLQESGVSASAPAGSVPPQGQRQPSPSSPGRPN